MDDAKALVCLAVLDRYRRLIRCLVPSTYEPEDVFQDVFIAAAVNQSRTVGPIPRQVGFESWRETQRETTTGGICLKHGLANPTFHSLSVDSRTSCDRHRHKLFRPGIRETHDIPPLSVAD